MIENKELKLFEFLEEEKDKLYKLENQNSKLKTTKAQLRLLEEIYKFCGFNFLKVAYLRENERKKWNHYLNLYKKHSKNKRKNNIDMYVLRMMQFLFKRLRNYDVLKIRKNAYVLHIKS